MKLFLIILIIVFVLFRLVSKSPKYRGISGERKVAGQLGKLIDQLEGAWLFHDLILKTPDGSTQIDHLVLSTSGIFVIETKNMSGWIFGDEKQRRWTQTIYKKKSQFQNPIHQNYKHVKAVQSLLSADMRVIFNVVVFVGDAEFKTAMPNNVLKMRELLPYVRSQTQHLVREVDVERYASLVINASAESSISEKEHVENIRNNRKNPLCSKCGGPMVLCTARKGSSKGTRFWGCSKFPVCKSTKNAD